MPGAALGAAQGTAGLMQHSQIYDGQRHRATTGPHLAETSGADSSRATQREPNASPWFPKIISRLSIGRRLSAGKWSFEALRRATR